MSWRVGKSFVDSEVGQGFIMQSRESIATEKAKGHSRSLVRSERMLNHPIAHDDASCSKIGMIPIALRIGARKTKVRKNEPVKERIDIQNMVCHFCLGLNIWCR